MIRSDIQDDSMLPDVASGTAQMRSGARGTRVGKVCGSDPVDLERSRHITFRLNALAASQAQIALRPAEF